jgi:hypothetical protein
VDDGCCLAFLARLRDDLTHHKERLLGEPVDVTGYDDVADFLAGVRNHLGRDCDFGSSCENFS